MATAAPGVSPELIREVLTNRLLFLETLIMIEDKSRKIMPLRLNPIQRRAYPYLVKPGGRHVLLKPAQVGMSTFVIALFFVDTITTPGTTSVIVAHEEFITQRLLQRAQFYYDMLPEQFRPVMSRKSANEKFFPELNSTLYIGTARAHVFGRGEPIHNFLGDEYAFWPDPERILVPTMQRVPPAGRIIIQSTPNGKDNGFAHLYEEATKGNSVWESHFFPWFEHPEYQMPGDTLSDLDSLEHLLKVQHGLSDNQLRWRRHKRDELRGLRQEGTSVFMFDQEFPSDDVSCFLAMGDMAFDPGTMDRLSASCVPAPFRHEEALVWEKPETKYDYIIGVDPGQGRQTRSALTTWRFEVDKGEDGRETTKAIHCATWVGLFNEEDTARKAVSLGHYFNGAVIAPEANNHGIAVVTELKNVHRYPSLYMRRDIVDGVQSLNIGWLTDRKTKPYMVKELRTLLPTMVCKDAQVIAELRNQRVVEGNLVSEGLGDLFMASAVAMVCRSSIPVTRGFAGTSGWSENW